MDFHGDGRYCPDNQAQEGRSVVGRSWATVLAVTAATAACAGAFLSDAAVVWCKANLAEVASAATSLALPPPDGFESWKEWGDLATASATITVDGWSALLAAGDLPNRDRACAAAYDAR